MTTFQSLRRSLSLQERDDRGEYELVPFNKSEETVDQQHHSVDNINKDLYEISKMEEDNYEAAPINNSNINKEVGYMQNHCKQSKRILLFLVIIVILNLVCIFLLTKLLEQGGLPETSHDTTAIGNASNQIASDFNVSKPILKEENNVKVKTGDSTGDCLASIQYTAQIRGNSDSVFCPGKMSMIQKKCLCAKQLEVCKGTLLQHLSCGNTGKYDCAGQDNPCQNQGFLERCDDGYCQKISYCDDTHELLLLHTKCNCHQTDYSGDFCHLPKVLQCSACEGDHCLNLKFCNSTFKDYPCLYTVDMTLKKCFRKTASSNLPLCGASVPSTSMTTTKVDTTSTTFSKKEFLISDDGVTKSKVSDNKSSVHVIQLIYILPYAFTTAFVSMIWISYLANYRLLCLTCDLPRVCIKTGICLSFLLILVSNISYGMLLMDILKELKVMSLAFFLLNVIQMLMSACFVFSKLIRQCDKKTDQIEDISL